MFKIIVSDRAGVIVSRDCHFVEIGADPKMCHVSHSQSVESCNTCTGDLCNSPAGRAISMGAVALFSIVAVTMTL